MSELRVATLNIWNRCGPWEQRLPAIRKWLAELSPDVIGLQEVLRPRGGSEVPDQAALIAEGLGYHIAYGAAWASDEFEFGNAVLSRFPIVHSDVHMLPGLDTDETRCLVHTELDAPFGKLAFFATHLNWKFHEGYVREAQVREVAARIKALVPMHAFPPIVVGDFNAEPDADEIRYMRGLCSLGGKSVYFADTFGITGNRNAADRGATFCRRNPFAGQLGEPDRRIDYIFVRGPDSQGRGEPLVSRVCFDEPVDGIFPSDHFGVLSVIRTIR
jgi:endonuclease/exonuclease/phosphatase family metal-dependent hydrolase